MRAGSGTVKPPPPPTVAGNGSSRIALIRGRLARAGYAVTREAVGSGRPVPIGVLNVAKRRAGAGAFGVTVYVFRTAPEARTARRAFGPVEKSNRKQIEVEVVGPDLYVGTIEEPAVLPLAEFEKLVSAAEGR